MGSANGRSTSRPAARASTRPECHRSYSVADKRRSFSSVRGPVTIMRAAVTALRRGGYPGTTREDVIAVVLDLIEDLGVKHTSGPDAAC
jgi:hypothetical protein